MNLIIGFTIIENGKENELRRATLAQNQALSHFNHLKQITIELGKTKLILWGHNDLEKRLQYLHDGALLVLVGSPIGDVSWSIVQDSLLTATSIKNYELPWDGRFILFKISF